MKLIFKPDGTKEFFVTDDHLPEVLYSDGTTGYPSTYRQVDASGSRDVRIKNEPHLKLWGRKLPSIGELADANRRPDAVDETAGVGSPVGITASAIDPDDEVSYSIGGSDELFAIDPKTGVITVAAALDFETAESHRLWVTATSADTSTATKEFNIAVRPINESAVGEIVDADDAVYADYVLRWSGVEDHINENAEMGAQYWHPTGPRGQLIPTAMTRSPTASPKMPAACSRSILFPASSQLRASSIGKPPQVTISRSQPPAPMVPRATGISTSRLRT